MKKYVTVGIILLILGSFIGFFYNRSQNETDDIRDSSTESSEIPQKQEMTDTEQKPSEYEDVLSESSSLHEQQTEIEEQEERAVPDLLSLTLTEEEAQQTLENNMPDYFHDEIVWEATEQPNINGWSFSGVAYTGGFRANVYIWPINETQVSVIVENRSSLTGYLGTDTYIFEISRSSVEASEFPYAVQKNKLPNIMTFTFDESVNLPSAVSISEIDSDSQIVSFSYNYPEQTSEHTQFMAIMHTIETKSIRVFSPSYSDVREVFVNTEITLKEQISGSVPMTPHSLYLFVNKDGGYSLATPNYAGNVSDDMRDVMLEVLQ